MAATVDQVLAAFDSLDPAEKQRVAVEVIRRSSGADVVSDEALDQLAAELFQGYDTEEESGGGNH